MSISIAEAQKQDLRVKVMSFNIRMSHGDDGINSWENRQDLLIRTLKEKKADVIGMQEVTSEQYLFLKEKLKDYHSYAVGRKDGKLEDEIAAIFYLKKYQVMEDSTAWLSETPTEIGSKSWDAALYRTVSWAKLKDPKSDIPFYLFNTHFDHRGVEARKQSARLIIELIKENIEGIPTILTGDFNVTAEDEPYQVLTKKWKGHYLLKDAREISISGHEGGDITYNGFKDDFGRVIDFIFVTEGIEVLEHRYLNIKEGEIFISDHYPVEAVVRVSANSIQKLSSGTAPD
jgi:endonuclease/exonuclease/phosphatase family metal-dependent hydrolase